MKNDRQISAALRAFDFELGQITRAINETGIFYAIDNLSGPVLDLLAFGLHMDFYDLAHDLETKREFIKNSLKLHMKKGTQAAIIDALKLIGVDAKFIHWKDFGGQPYTFKIEAKITGDFYRTAGQDKIMSSILRVIEDTKSARSQLAGLDTQLNFSENLNFFSGVAALFTGNEKILFARRNENLNAKIFAGFGAWRCIDEIIRPRGAKEIHTKSFTAMLSCEIYSQSVGISLKIMQELLSQFENRIFARLEELERKIDLNAQIQNQAISDGLRNIEKLLEWKGDDEELS